MRIPKGQRKQNLRSGLQKSSYQEWGVEVVGRGTWDNGGGMQTFWWAKKKIILCEK